MGEKIAGTLRFHLIDDRIFAELKECFEHAACCTGSRDEFYNAQGRGVALIEINVSIGFLIVEEQYSISGDGRPIKVDIWETSYEMVDLLFN